MSDSWNALFMPTWTCAIHYISKQTFSDILHFKKSYLSTRFVTGSSSQTDTPILNILSPDLDKCNLAYSLSECCFNNHFPACCFDQGTPSFLHSIGYSSPPLNESYFTSKALHSFLPPISHSTSRHQFPPLIEVWYLLLLLLVAFLGHPFTLAFK